MWRIFCELYETASVAELHQNTDWAVSEHPVLRQILSRVQSDDSLTTSLPRALSDHTGQDWAACQVNQTKTNKKLRPSAVSDHWNILRPSRTYFWAAGKCYFWVLTLNTMLVQMYELWSETKVTLRSLSGYHGAISCKSHHTHLLVHLDEDIMF